MAKKIIIVLAVLLALLAGAFLYLRNYLKSPDLTNQLRERIYQLVREKSRGRYTLTIGEININADKRSASLRDIRLIPDTAIILDGMMYQFELKNLFIKNVDIAELLGNQSVNLNNITVAGGILQMTSLGSVSKKDSTAKPDLDESKEKILKSVRKSLTGVQVDTLQLNDINLIYSNRKKRKHTLKKIHIDLFDLAIDSAGLADKSRILFARSARVSIDSLNIPVSKNRYRLKADKLVLTMGEKKLTLIRGLELRSFPYMSMEAAAAKTGVQKDIYRVQVKEITVLDFDYIAMFEDSLISAKSVSLKSPVIQVFNDKSNPPATDSKLGKYPHQLLRKLPYKIDIPIMKVENGAATYYEKNEKGDGVGKIFFTGIDGKLGPLEDDGIDPKTLKADFAARFMGRSAVTVNFEFPISDNGTFLVGARFSPFDATQLNAASLPLGSTRIVSGKINRLSFRVKGNNLNARAYTSMNYDDLKIEIMKGGEDQGYKKRGLLSAIANAFVLRQQNLPGDKFPDQTSATYQRVTTKSFFNLVWKSVFYSVKENVGVGLKGRDKERATIH